MSLIIEALRRARDDSSRRQAASRGLPLAPIPRTKRRNRWLRIAFVPLVAALVISMVLIVDLYSRLPPAEVAAADPANSSQRSLPVGGESPGSTFETDPPSPAPTEPVGRAANAAPDSSVIDSLPELPIAAREADRSRSPSEVEPAPTPPVIPQPPRQARSELGDRSAREFVGQAQLRDGQLLDLEGIAWSESQPFALLNGQVIGVGEFIRAYRVTSISRDQVVLEQEDDRIILRLE